MSKTPIDPQIAMSEQESIKNGLVFNKQEKRFYSRMPWKSSPSLLRNNKQIAITAHQNMKKKAHKHSDHPSMIKDTFYLTFTKVSEQAGVEFLSLLA